MRERENANRGESDIHVEGHLLAILLKGLSTMLDHDTWAHNFCSIRAGRIMPRKVEEAEQFESWEVIWEALVVIPSPLDNLGVESSELVEALLREALVWERLVKDTRPVHLNLRKVRGTEEIMKLNSLGVPRPRSPHCTPMPHEPPK